MASILAIDPGTNQSAVVQWDGQRIISAEITPNDEIVYSLELQSGCADLVIEWIESYGMAVGKEVFITCRWCGIFEHAAKHTAKVHYVTRKQIKSHHCHTIRATDANIRQALIDRFGAPGVKKAPGLTYGLKKDLWAAFALATYWWDTNKP